MTIAHSIYLHVPFCRQICTYCAFNTYAGMDDLIPAYMDALRREVRYAGERAGRREILSVFWGGGTPSMIPAPMIAAVHDEIGRWFQVRSDAELSLEGNPNDLTPEYVRGLFSAGVNRLSIGWQSVHERELAMYGRQHDMALNMAALEAARAVGIDNVSIDLMFGNPLQSAEEWYQSVARTLEAQPHHVSLYGLEVKGGTELKRQVMRGEVNIPDEEATAQMYESAMAAMPRAGLHQYEISNFARTGFESKHNQQYWQDDPYFGFGAGAHGFVDGIRTIGVRSPYRYIERMKGTDSDTRFPRTPATSKAQAVNSEEAMSEFIMLGLRMTSRGIERQRFRERFGVDVVDVRHDAVTRLKAPGLLDVTRERMVLQPSAYLISNRVIAELI